MEDEVQDDMDLLESGSSDSDDDYGPMVRTEGMELEEFDRNLPAAHSYLPNNLQPIPGRSVLEPGWTGRVLCWRHKSVVFPGETIPMVFVNTLDMDIMQHMIQGNRLFGLVFKEIQGLEGTHTYGVLCEVVEATPPVNTAGHHLFREPFSFKAKARQRFILKAKGDVLIRRIDSVEIKILPDVSLNDPLENVRFSSLGRHKNVPKTRMNELVRKADSMTTPWPQFVYDVFDVDRVVEKIREYFSKMAFANLPNDNLSLSYWVGTNLSVSNKDRLSLFCTNNIVLRLSMELYHIGQKSRVLCCVLCGTEVCEKSKVFAMSNEGIYSNFCNIGGYVHDIMTASEVTNLTLQGTPSTKFTWFPGYSWTIAVCTTCGSHVGWRFDACKVNLNPASFWGLGRRSLVHDTENNVFEDPMSENRNPAPTTATPTSE